MDTTRRQNKELAELRFKLEEYKQILLKVYWAGDDEERLRVQMEVHTSLNEEQERSYRDKHPIREFLPALEERLEMGKANYGEDSYKDKDVIQDAIEELLDLMNYAYLEILKLMELRERLEEVHHADNLGR